MIERLGRIVNISSMIGETGGIGQANYASSKSGLFGLTKSLAREACFARSRRQAPRGLDRHHGQCGGPRTHRDRDPRARTREGARADRVADSRWQVRATGRDRGVVHFVASDYSSFITGAVWDVNGGREMKIAVL